MEEWKVESFSPNLPTFHFQNISFNTRHVDELRDSITLTSHIALASAEEWKYKTVKQHQSG